MLTEDGDYVSVKMTDNRLALTPLLAAESAETPEPPPDGALSVAQVPVSGLADCFVIR